MGEQPLRDLVRALYVSNQIPHLVPLNTTIPAGAGLPATQVRGTLFFDVPHVTMAADSGNRLQIDLRAWGTVRLTAAGATFRPNVLITSTVLVPPSLSFVQVQPPARRVRRNGEVVTEYPPHEWRLGFGLSAATAVVQSVNVSVIGGGVTQAQVQMLTATTGFQTAFQTFVQQQLGAIGPAALGVGFLGGLLLAPTKTATTRVLDGALAIGIDVGWQVPIMMGFVPVYPAPTVESHGDPNSLNDFRDGADLAYWIHPAQVPMNFADVYTRIREAARDQQATLDELSVTTREGAIHVAGAASTTGLEAGTGRFAFDIVPTLSTDIDPVFETIHFSVRDIQVDVTPDKFPGRFAHDIGGFFTLGALAFYVDGVAESMKGKLRAQIAASDFDDEPLDDEGAIRRRLRRFALSAAGKPPIELYVQTLRPHENGLSSTIRLRPQLRGNRVAGVSRLWSDGGGRAQLLYAVTLADDILRSDPQLMVRWTVRRLDLNRAIADETRRALDGRTYRADLSFLDVASPPPLVLTCTVVRPLGAGGQTLYTRTVRIEDNDRLDRTHPYVRWRSNVKLPTYVRKFSRSRAEYVYRRNRFDFLRRTSTIHRTDLPGRCLFADQYSYFADPEYLDRLPGVSREDQLVRNRDAFCDYCFFGGPDKDRPLV